MVPAAPDTVALCLRFSADLVRAAAALLIAITALSAAEPPSHLPASTLQDFQCPPADDLPAADVLAIAAGLQGRTAGLSGAQLSCLAGLLAAKDLTGGFRRFPPDLLLFFDLSEVRGGTCGEFYARASRGNLDLLPWGSAQRRGLLRGALGCLGVRSSRLHPEQLRSLGALVCDMEPQTIPASGPSILENLKLCPTLTRPQRDALNALLLAGGTSYGAPSCWDLQTLQDLGPLVMALNQTTLSLVAKAEREALARSIVATYSSQGLAQREKSLTLLRTLVAPSASSDARVKRNADGCSPKPITASTLSDPIFFIYYTPREFELCLTEEVLKSDLELLLEFPLPGSYLGALKNRLEQIYPSGIPEEQLRLLGSFSCLFSVEEISRWPVQSNETLSALLAGGCGAPQAQEMIRRFLELGGAFAGPLLRRMGGEKLCGLPEEELQRLPAALMGVVGQLNISSCSPAKKTLLYRTARAHLGTSGYCWLRPFLGGAPAEDLKALAEGEEPVNMDMETFLSLNPEELQKLSVLDVKNLLGTNLPALKAAENEPLVVLWLEKQSQRDLDCILGIGLRGGTSTPPHPTVSASSTPSGPKPSTLPTGPTAPAVSPSTEPSPPLHTTAGSTHQPSPAVVTHSAPSTLVPTSSTPTVSTSPSVPAGTTHPIPPTHSTTTTSTSSAPSTPTVSTSPSAPAGSTHPTPATHSTITTSTQNVPCTLVPNSTSPLASRSPPGPAGTTHTTITPSTHSAPSTSTSPLVSTNPPGPAGTTHPVPATPSTHAPSTHSAPSTLVPASSTPTVSTSPSAPAGTATPTPATPSAASTLVPSSTSTPAPTAATALTLSPHKPTPSSTTSTQRSVVPSAAVTTLLPCQTRSPPASPSSTETPKATATGLPEPPRSTSNGYINLPPAAGSASGPLRSCLPHVLAAAVGSSVLRALL